MSQDDERSIVRAAIEAFNRGDPEAMLASVHPDVEWTGLRSILEGTVYHGHAGVRRWYAESNETWSEMEIRWDDDRVAPGVVVVLGRLRLRGRASGARTERPLGWVFRFEDGEMRRAEVHATHADALAAAAPPATPGA